MDTVHVQQYTGEWTCKHGENMPSPHRKALHWDYSRQPRRLGDTGMVESWCGSQPVVYQNLTSVPQGQMLMWTEEQFHFFFCAYFRPNVIGSWSRAEVHQQELSAAVPLPTQSGAGSHLHLRKPALTSRILHLHFWAADGGGDASFMYIDVGGVPWTQKQEFGGMFWSCEDDVLNLK